MDTSVMSQTDDLATLLPMGKLIGLSGLAGSGKDYIDGRLYDFLDGGSLRVAFADGVRFEIESAFGVDRYGLGALWDKPYSDEIRQLLQLWGTEYRRSQDPLHWVEYGRREIERAWETTELVVITDVRFQNEADLVRDLGGIVVQVQAADHVRLERLGGVDAGTTHASEVIDFDPDYYILNDDDPYCEGGVLDYLGFSGGCFPCISLNPHPWHDNGAPWPLWADSYLAPPHVL